MLKMIQKRLPIELSNEDAAYIQQNLQTRYNSLFHKIRLEYLNRLGLDTNSYSLTLPSASSELILGELFMPEPGLICYIKAVRGSGYLEAGAITNEAECDTDSFFIDVREAVCERCQNVPSWQLPPEYETLSIDGSEPGNISIEPKDMAAARALMDSASRNLLAKIKDAGSIFLNKIYTDDRKTTEAYIRNFEALKLINKEYAVLCRRTGQQILRVAERSTIDESSQKSFKCFICGNPIAQEVVEEIATSNDLCSEMFNDNKWLLVLIQGILGELGVPSEAIRVYRDPNLPARLFLNINGLRFLLVLCTEELNLDQANLISAHLTAYSLHQAIIVSTHNISTLMRHHLAKLNENTVFHFICDLNNLDASIKDILLGELRNHVIAQLNDISKATPICIPSLVIARMLPQPVKQEEAPEASQPAPESEPAPVYVSPSEAEPKAESDSAQVLDADTVELLTELTTDESAADDDKASKKSKKSKKS
ncbi:hypothetical protein IJT17_04530 [bacterium]|nr:hypothetical protein [bacterium]